MRRLGGTQALLRGLGTDRERGLSKESLVHNSRARAYQTAEDKEQRDREEAKKRNRRGCPWKHPGQGASRPTPELSLDVLRASFDERRRVYGSNILPRMSSKSFVSMMWLALKDNALLLLFVVALVSLAVGLFQNFGSPRPDAQSSVDWTESVAIMAALTIIVVVSSLNHWREEGQFRQLHDKKEKRGVKVIRDGVRCVIDSKEVVVGDIALLEPGEVVPCDGVLLSGQLVRCNEPSTTGDSDAMRKLSYEECMQSIERDGHLPANTDCFIVSGSNVLDGVGRYVVIAVGTKSFRGRSVTALQRDPKTTPLQQKLDMLAELVAKFGLNAGLALFVALLIRLFVELAKNSPVRTGIEKGVTFINILIISITLVVVVVPKGLPLIAVLAVGFATKSMIRENLLVCDLGSCETMANASIVCTDKTGTLTQNVMTVVAGSIGIHAKFVRELNKHPGRHNADGKVNDRSLSTRRDENDFCIDQSQINSVLTPALRELFNETIVINSIAFEHKNPITGESMFVGDTTEAALLQFAKELGWRGRQKTPEVDVVQMIPFSSERKAMAVVVRLPRNTGFRVYVKGAPEILLKNCTDHVVVRPSILPGRWERRKRVETKAIGMREENVSETIRFYASQALRTVALCYRDLEQWSAVDMENDVTLPGLAQDLTLIAIIGIDNPLRPGVPEAISKCRRAGVTIKMCTGDNIETARTVALQCGILTSEGNIKEGMKFRERSHVDRIKVASELQVLARSSPADKEALVSTLKSTGAIVSMTGDSALKEANVGFSMGISGTEAAKTTSDMILADDSFVSIYKAIMWGRCVIDAVRKCLQFQVTALIAIVIITFVLALTNTQGLSIQLLWISIVLDTFAGLALVTDPASESLLDRQPDKTAHLFTTDMYKQIFFQSIYQISTILTLHFFGLRMLCLKFTGDTQADRNTGLVVQTLVFNVFVFIQIFNSANCRRLDRKLNVFSGILRHRYFLAITLIEIILQIVIIFVARNTFKVTRLGWREWGISLGFGAMPIPLGTLIRLLPNESVEKALKKLGLLGWPQVLPTVSAEGEAWSPSMNIVEQNLGIYMKVRGARMKSSFF
ncbi:hypothetical protein H2248_008764 [Termitomyces sp. 'cryptogamus']|nr:hypothetical protein H2248_008764 [Termitomyces sp. 'cryptogamus']